jgi:ABC-type transport system involved in cytochrome bd biosynthesis fused ATPase/permease subunit
MDNYATALIILAGLIILEIGVKKCLICFAKGIVIVILSGYMATRSAIHALSARQRHAFHTMEVIALTVKLTYVMPRRMSMTNARNMSMTAL